MYYNYFTSAGTLVLDTQRTKTNNFWSKNGSWTFYPDLSRTLSLTGRSILQSKLRKTKKIGYRGIRSLTLTSRSKSPSTTDPASVVGDAVLAISMMLQSTSAGPSRSSSPSAKKSSTMTPLNHTYRYSSEPDQPHPYS